MNLKKYEEMPDRLKPEETRRLFEELLSLPPPRNSEELLEAAEALWQVADRQWNTRTLLDATAKRTLDDWIIKNWDRTSPEMTSYLLGTIARIGLAKSFQFMKEAMEAALDDSVRKEILEAIEEFGSTIEDPYSGMRQGETSKE